ncbi:unnamed protein product [Cuscuta campestris]|uniref:Uncharacterized protein n=1 Tax=Cuscuta campestris TaxID=132261 RepID=A0A484KHY5_9ASTE|nr:unnamed protein product [Cuscuta campestris]
MVSPSTSPVSGEKTAGEPASSSDRRRLGIARFGSGRPGSSGRFWTVAVAPRRSSDINDQEWGSGVWLTPSMLRRIRVSLNSNQKTEVVVVD